MQITINGQNYPIADRITLHDLINELKCMGGNIAVAVNYKVIPKSNYLNVWLDENDKVEIVTAFQGG
jgi:thiamine biosynthesis protein ThiS